MSVGYLARSLAPCHCSMYLNLSPVPSPFSGHGRTPMISFASLQGEGFLPPGSTPDVYRITVLGTILSSL